MVPPEWCVLEWSHWGVRAGELAVHSPTSAAWAPPGHASPGVAEWSLVYLVSASLRTERAALIRGLCYLAEYREQVSPSRVIPVIE